MHFVLTTCLDFRATMSSQLRTASLQGASGWISNCQWNFHILESSCHIQGKKGSKAFRVWRNEDLEIQAHWWCSCEDYRHRGRKKWLIHLELHFAFLFALQFCIIFDFAAYWTPIHVFLRAGAGFKHDFGVVVVNNSDIFLMHLLVAYIWMLRGMAHGFRLLFSFGGAVL